MRCGPILVIACAFAGRAAADSSSTRAEELFRQGRDLMAAGKLAEACTAFDASQKLDPATTTLLNQADCREKNGQLATAWGLFVDAQRATRGATDAAGKRMHQVASDRAAKLDKRLSRVTVQVQTPLDGLVVLRDAKPLDRGEWGHALAVDGGTYNFTARLGDRDVWSETITVQNEKDAQTVTVVVKRVPPRDTAPPPQTADTTAPPTTTTTTNVDAPPTRRSRTAPVIATIGAAVLLGGALIFDLSGDSTYNTAVTNRDMSLWSQANDKRHAAIGFALAGAVTGGVAVWLWLRGGEKPRAVAPVVGSGYAGVQLGGRW